MLHLRLAIAVMVVTGCSAPNPRATPPPVQATPIALTPRPESGSDLQAPQFCHLGRDCMELDSRPFTSCLVDAEPCAGDGIFIEASPRVIVRSPAVPAQK